ncbi:MAG TPA: hypothetical protein PKD10_18605 [Paracoccaceae bacterium]|nr:hypothetical protein [Paracoccaceae bacterium]HMO72369.1 hypothetical protein [Paracoccaceae bacterium]
MTNEPLFSAPVQPVDLVRIEAEARRMRAEVLRDGIRRLTLRLAALWQGLRAGTARAA